MLFLSNCTKKNDVKNEYEKETKEISYESFSSQYDYIHTVMNVNTWPDSLNVRNIPSVDGDIINTLSPMTDVLIIDEDVNTVNINGIDGKWVKIKTTGGGGGGNIMSSPIKGWVFSGYLEKKQLSDIFTKRNNIEDIMVGDWRIIDEDYDPTEDTIFFMGLCLVKDEYNRRWIYSNYGTEGMYGGLWEVVDYETIKLDCIDDGVIFETFYLNNIKFIDNDMITCSLFNKFTIMKNRDRDWNWNGD
jgi:hypothetical protein